MVVSKEFILDGEKNYIEIRNIKDEVIVKETSFEKAKKKAFEKGYRNPRKYKVFIKINTVRISIDSCQYTTNGWLCKIKIKNEKGFWLIKERTNEEVNKIGYIIFDKGDVEKSDRSKCRETSKELIKLIRESIEKIMRESGEIYKHSVNEMSHIKLQIFGGGNIYICFNSQLMDLNQQRKNNDKRVLPFEKCMDKYSTFYFYMTDFDPKNKTDKILDELYMNQFLEKLIKNINEISSDHEAKYKEVEFMGRIFL